MNQFWQISGIIIWVLLIGYILLRVIYGKKWQLKAGANFFMGSGLMGAAKKLTEEANQADIKRETITEVAVHVFWRLTKVGLFAIIIAMIPFILLYQQNNLLKIQNKKINSQNNLIEADRRSSLVFLMSNVLDKVDDEIKEQRIEFEKQNVPREKMRFRLSVPLIARTVALSKAFKPYRMYNGDRLAKELISPERAQLFHSLMDSQLDSLTQNSIARKGEFLYATIADINLSKANLSFANLTHTNLRSANFESADLRSANFRFTSLSLANFRRANLQKVTISSAYFGNTAFDFANLQKAILVNTDFGKANFNSADLSSANLRYSKFRGAKFSYANLSFANFEFAELNYANFSNANFKDVENLTAEQLSEAWTLHNAKNLPPEIEAQLRKEKPCLFTLEGCSSK